MRFWKVGTCAAGLLSSVVGLAQADHPMPPIDGPMVQFVAEPQGPCRHGVMAGASIYFLRPHYTTNAAFILNTGIGTGNPSSSTEDFDWNYRVAPAGWIGYTSKCGVGVRGRYFIFDHDAEPATANLTAGQAGSGMSITPPRGLSPVLDAPPRGFESPGVLLQLPLGQDALSFDSDLRVQTADGEATYAYDHGNFSMMISVGGRYLELQQNYLANLSNVVDPNNFEVSTLSSSRKFTGGGPTMSFYARYQFGHSGLSVFGLARGSILVGTSRENTVFNERVVEDITGTESNTATVTGEEDIVIPVGELEAGFEYGRHLGRTRILFRGAAVNHTYMDSGSPSSREGSLSLFGAQLSLGLNY